MTAYREAGVDQHAADALVGTFAKLAARTRRLECVDEVGGFGGLFSLEGLANRGYRRPALVCSTDGVGTKTELLRDAGLHHTAGWDAVAMNVDDVVCVGAEPLFCVDYVSVEQLDAQVVEAIVSGVADGCAEAGCALVGGETSQHPGIMPPNAYDVVATCVGVVDLDRTWGPHRVTEGDAVVGLASTGLHANGFSLVRRLWGGQPPPAGLLAPTAIYARRLLALAEDIDVHAAAHVTGGGIAGNLSRVLPEGCGARIDPESWPVPEVFELIAARGVGTEDMRSTFNLGLGMLVVVTDGDEAVDALRQAGVESWTVGSVVVGSGVTVG